MPLLRQMRLLALFYLGLLTASVASAQTWGWLRGADCPENSYGIEFDWLKSDPFNNLYVGISYSGDSLCLGSYTFHNRRDSIYDNTQVVMAKYNNSGDLLWAHNSATSSYNPLLCIATDAFGNLYGLGNYDTVAFGPYSIFSTFFDSSFFLDEPAFLVKYNAAGDVVWLKDIGNISIEDEFTPQITTDGAGNVYLTAAFFDPETRIGSFTLTNPSSYGNNGLIAKIDTAGTVVWAKSLNKQAQNGGLFATVTNDYSVYVTGLRDSALLKLDTAGNLLWARLLPAQIQPHCIAADSKDNIYVGGSMSLSRYAPTVIDSTYSFMAPVIDSVSGADAAFFIKYDSSGKILNTEYLPPSPSVSTPLTYSIHDYYITNAVTGIVTDTCGNIWITGTLYNTAGIQFDPATIDYAPPGNIDPMFLAEYGSHGFLLRHEVLKSGAVYGIYAAIAADQMNNIYVSGAFATDTFSLGNNTLYNSGINSPFLAQYHIDTIHATLDTTVCSSAPITLYAPPNSITYLWDNGTTGSERIITVPGQYWVSSEGACMSRADTFVVANDDALCDCTPFLPTAFTPNNDGLDDAFHPVFQNGCYIDSYTFAVYNRWGQRIFYTQNQVDKWDGTYQGVKADIGTYMYEVTYKTERNNNIHQQKGDITLVR